MCGLNKIVYFLFWQFNHLMLNYCYLLTISNQQRKNNFDSLSVIANYSPLNEATVICFERDGVK